MSISLGIKSLNVLHDSAPEAKVGHRCRNAKFVQRLEAYADAHVDSPSRRLARLLGDSFRCLPFLPKLARAKRRST